MLAAIFGAYPTSKWLYLTAAIMATLVLIIHLLRRKAAETACKSRFKRTAAISNIVLLVILTGVAWTGMLEMDDLLHSLGLFAGLGAVVLAVLTAGNFLRAPGSIAIRLIVFPLPIFVAIVAMAATMYTHNVYTSALHGNSAIWSYHTYTYALAAADYGVPGYLIAWVMPILVVWGIVTFGKKIKNLLTAP
jgi:hypothetical protein